MNKKFFTLLVALLTTISFGAYAQIVPSDPALGTGDPYSSTTAYLLRTDGGTYLAVDATGTNLITLPSFSFTSYADAQKALWYVKANPATSGGPVTLEYTNAYNGVKIGLSSAVAKPVADTPANNANGLGGDIEKWTPESGRTTVQATQTLYSIIDDGSRVYAMKENGNKVNIVIYNSIADASAVGAAMKVTPNTVEGSAALTANDLNTMIGKAGVYVPAAGKIMATNDSYFSFSFGTENTEPSPFTHTLQARAIERWEIEYGTEETPFIPAGSEGAYISMYPKGTLDGLTQEGHEYDAVRDESADGWLTLYSKDDDAYLVVDTVYVPGTLQANNARIEVTTDKLYNAKNATKYRLPESYLFKFVYNATNNSVEIISKAYVKQTTPVTAETTNNAVYYSGNSPAATPHSPANAYNTYNPVIKGSTWPNTLPSQARIDMAGDALVNDPAYGVNQKLIFAKLASAVAYTFGAVDANNSNLLTVLLSTPSQYRPIRVATGAYLLKVTGVFDPANKDRVGKYLKMNLIGLPEFVTLEKRQDFQEMPSAQWVIETTGTSSHSNTRIRNREFNNPFYLDATVANPIGTNPYFNLGQTYGTETSGQFFFLGGDTIEYTAVTAPLDKKLGYKYVDVDAIDLNRYEFRFLHELQMDKPISTLTDKDSAIWVDVNDDAIKFQLVKVADDTYGYTYNNTRLAKLERTAYKLKVYYSSNFEMNSRYVTYDAKNKKYYLQKGEEGASTFLMKANNTANDFNYYILLEANTTVDLDLVTVKDIAQAGGLYTLTANGKAKANYIVIDADVTGTNGYVVAGEGTETDENGIDQDILIPRIFTAGTVAGGVVTVPSDDDKVWQAMYAKYGNLVMQLPITDPSTTGYTYYVRVIGGYATYASTKVAVDNNTLSLINGVIYDSYNGEVNNSAFKVERDETIIYRTLGVEEDEEDNINIVKFFRYNSAATGKEYLYEDANSVYSTPVNGPDNELRKSQINFLGVEGKGMDMKSAMKTRYFSGDVMPQYLISVDEVEVPEVADIPCPIHGMDCIHAIKGSEGYITGRFLVNLRDSVAYYGAGTEAGQKFLWEKKYTRLAFVDGILTNDSVLHITSSAYTAENVADKNVFDLKVNHHSPVLFQFRLLDDSTNNFLIESESWTEENGAFAGGIAPTSQNGGWVKIQNGVPVIISETTESYAQAEIFNLEVTDENPTSNTGITEGTYNVTAGVGTVTIEGAAGKQVVIANILGKVVKNVTLDSDYVTLSAPAGVVVVTVDGEATKALVK